MRIKKRIRKTISQTIADKIIPVVVGNDQYAVTYIPKLFNIGVKGKVKITTDIPKNCNNISRTEGNFAPEFKINVARKDNPT